ncbi:hypothetical protein GCM10010191_19890 [Actinomadura vinacea]|uniref:MFS transporter n=1 Tax=Actinomadura vinacea TaxID=115336 RepID=A0ABN3IQG5_9ACTN
MLGLAALVGLLAVMPRLPSQGTIGFRELPLLLRDNPRARLGVIITFLLISGHFTAYTFVRPILAEVGGIEAGLIGVLLMAYGAAGIAGNFVAGSRATGNLLSTLITICAALGAVTAVFALTDPGPVTGIALLVVWGVAYGGVSVSLQTWMLRAAPGTPEAASSLFVATFNLSIALGALIGGAAADGIGLTGVLAVAACLLLWAAATIGTARTGRTI